ncbi:MAG: hypothetical protein UV98_C0004G0016 [Parcubacteria group bacterium GW2011_GWB1_43_6]|nr:MAG: hypothetical protein UV98_C0004G0016 [Parcubacteria group bacterium GW2011_GWB1_43_6]
MPPFSEKGIREETILKKLFRYFNSSVVIPAIIQAMDTYRHFIIYYYQKEARRFKRISAHEHWRKGGSIKPYLKVMKWANVEKVVFVPTDWPASNPKYKENLQELLELKRKYPDKIVVFATAYNKDPEAAKIIEDAILQGARGIKFIDWLFSEKFPDEAGRVDSENMYKVYEIAKRYKVPVLMHIDFQKKPEWKFQFERVATDFPEVKFILAHYARSASGENPALEVCADILEKFANVSVDISMGGGVRRYMRYFDQNPARWHDLILRYQDRILWGTDIILDEMPFKNSAWLKSRMLLDFLMLQKKTYHNPLHIEDVAVHKGLELAPAVLKKIYYDNPARILKF